MKRKKKKLKKIKSIKSKRTKLKKKTKEKNWFTKAWPFEVGPTKNIRNDDEEKLVFFGVESK